MIETQPTAKAPAQRKLCHKGIHWPPVRKFSRWICGTCKEAWPIKSVKKLILAILFLLLSSPAYSQVAAAGWCVVTDQKAESKSTDQPSQPPDDSFPPQPDESNSTTTSPLGCDIGVGFSLYTHNRLAVVAVVGSESIGSGIAWILNPTPKSSTDHRPVMAIAIGVVTPYDSSGIGRNIQLALGMTLSLRQRGEDE